MPAPANLVHQISTTTGTGNFTLSAVNGKQSFATAFGTGVTTDVFDYFISNEGAAEYERGTGHMSDSTTLVRDTVIESTNSNLAVSFSAGAKNVVNDIPALNQYRSDGTALTAVDTADKLPITDVSASNASKTSTVNEVFKAVTTFTAETSVDTADELSLYDASAAAADKCTVNNLFKAVNTFSAETAVDTADVLPIYDASAATADKCTVNELFKSVNTFTAETSVDSADVLSLYDASASTADKCTVAELFKSVNTLTADTAPDAAADYLLTYDASATAAKKALFTAFARERLSAARTYYVRTDGSNSNTGLANTSGGAFLTIQKAIDVATTLDASSFDVTIQVADGTYTENLTLKSFVGAGSIIINGNSTTPANVVLAGGSSTAITGDNIIGKWDLRYFKITGSGISISPTRIYLAFTGLVFAGTGSAHFYCLTDAFVIANGNYEISGSCGRHIWLASKAYFQCVSRTVTLTGTPDWSSYFIQSTALSSALINGNTYSGSATGTRYIVTLNSVINTGGGGPNYFPGNSAGSTATGGQYA